MDFSLSEENRMIQEVVRGWTANACPRDKVLEWDGQNGPPAARLAELAELGFCGITVPEAFGGQGSDLLGACLVMEELAALSPPLAAQYAAAALWGGAALNALGSTGQKNTLLPACANGESLVALALGDPDDQSWPGPEAPKFVRSGNDFILNGSWRHVLLADRAGLFLVAVLDQGRDASNWTMFLAAPQDGLVVEPLETLGLHGAALSRVTFDQIRLSQEAVLGGPGHMGQGPGQWECLAGLVSLSWAALALGLARGAFDYALEYSKQRIQFKQPIGTFPAIREKLVDLEINLNAARLLTHQAASLADTGRGFARIAHQSQLLAVRTARDAGLLGLHTLGGYGYTMEYDAQRYLRDALGLVALGPSPAGLTARLGAGIGL
jgi:alkylation response protein AidB-like acyl-CoA dehydrogenase